jgi:ssDNA-binding Zn-finger/Zn-ribbon topoisomerase 1
MKGLQLTPRPRFPCPICGEPLDARKSKKGKPYVVCNVCGVQMFVRFEPGVREFEKLVAEATAKNIWGRLADLERQYRKSCPKCGKSFWVSEQLIKTSTITGSFIGFRCPEEDCDGVVKPEEKK